jgi:hypothetical protein
MNKNQFNNCGPNRKFVSNKAMSAESICYNS